ncbi:flavin reductase family protein [Amycolatopsis sp. NBC_00438]|uniref:flavin reductase family protein n=1 Tax=Amycolatopsis sp. NBC_00438 TaxID=2903558 RepID=UPI002E1F3B6D
MSPDLRGVMRTFATGVCVATTYRDSPDGRHHDAVTVNSLGSISLDPPLISLSFRKESVFLADLLATGAWVVSILPAGARELAGRFAGPRASRVSEIALLQATPGERTGALVLDGASWLECTLRQPIDLGDHTLVVGEVLATGHDRQAPALVFVHGTYHSVTDPRQVSGPGQWGEAVG